LYPDCGENAEVEFQKLPFFPFPSEPFQEYLFPQSLEEYSLLEWEWAI
jgi:hypothetical protein